jgi:hypothetical protein
MRRALATVLAGGIRQPFDLILVGVKSYYLLSESCAAFGSTGKKSFLLCVKCLPPTAIAHAENVITQAVAWIRNAA